MTDMFSSSALASDECSKAELYLAWQGVAAFTSAYDWSASVCTEPRPPPPPPPSYSNCVVGALNVQSAIATEADLDQSTFTLEVARSQIAAILGISVDRVQVTADYYFHDNTVARGTCTPAGPFAADGMDPAWPSSEILKLKLPGGLQLPGSFSHTDEEYNHAWEWVDDTDGSDCDTYSIDEDQPCIVPPDNGKVAAAACSLMDVAYGSAAYENACGHFTFLPTDSIENPWEVRTWWLYKDSIQKDVTADPGYTNNPSDGERDRRKVSGW